MAPKAQAKPGQADSNKVDNGYSRILVPFPMIVGMNPIINPEATMADSELISSTKVFKLIFKVVGGYFKYVQTLN